MNKILVGIIAATIIGGMAFMQPTEAQADDCYTPPKGTLVAINSFDIRDYLCHMYVAVDPDWKIPYPVCLSCPSDIDLEYSTIDQAIINEYRTLVLSDKIDMLSEDISSQNSDDEVIIIIIIIVASLLGVSIALGAANLVIRKR